MAKSDTARAFYESARKELILRIKLRDNALLFYLGLSGTILSISLGGENHLQEILLVIPLLSYPFTLIIVQHHTIIGALGVYCSEKIGSYFKELKPSEDAPQWDNSDPLLSISKFSMTSRLWAHLAVILIPSSAAILLSFQDFCDKPQNYQIIWCLGLLFFFGDIISLIGSDKKREKYYKSIKPKIILIK